MTNKHESPYPHWPGAHPDSEEAWFAILASLARYLRGPHGCPWDKEQAAADFGRYVREEATEMEEAFTGCNPKDIEEEWGDTFFVLMATAIAAEQEGLFSLKNALARAHEKMVRRHEHVFGGDRALSPEEAISRWNVIKAREKEAST